MSAPFARQDSPADAGTTAVYCRISRDREGAGLGVERQRDDCLALAERSGLVLASGLGHSSGDMPSLPGTYVDNDISAYSGKKRPAYRRLLADVIAGRVRTVIVWHTDRLHRSPVELEEWIDAAEKHGCSVLTVTAGILDLSTPAGRMNARITGAVARHESEHKSERIKRQKAQALEQGKYRGGQRPFGFMPNGVTHLDEEAELIREGTAAILAGDSLRSIQKDWNARGFRTSFKGKEFTGADVRDVLTRARNCGKVVHHGTVVGSAGWEPIVTEDEWRGVCLILADPSRRTSPGNEVRHLGSGIYRCGICDGPMSAGTTGAKHQPSYLCRARYGSTTDKSRHVSRDLVALDRYVVDFLLERIQHPEYRAAFTTAGATGNELMEWRAELEEVQAEQNEIAELLANGAIKFTQFKTINASLAAREADLNERLATAQTDSPLAQLVLSADPVDLWEDWDIDLKRAALRAALVVRVLPTRTRGRQPGGGYFNPASIEIDVVPQ